MSFDLSIQNGDLSVVNGQLALVTGQTKLIQDILKICLTRNGSNIFQPWYGSSISNSMIGSFLAEDITLSVAKAQLQVSIENLKKVQELQASTGQKMSPDEQISYITDISINRNPIDYRLIQIKINVLTKSFSKTTVNFTVGNITNG